MWETSYAFSEDFSFHGVPPLESSVDKIDEDDDFERQVKRKRSPSVWPKKPRDSFSQGESLVY